jgi:hypothetical protein
MLDHFYALTCISNPARFRSRYELYRKFAAHIQASGVRLLTVELAFGNRPHEVTSPGNPFHLQLRTDQELWHKENLLNLGIARLPADWQYVAWIDADIEFLRPDWALETVHQLQHHQVVQMWTDAIDRGPHGEVIQSHHSFGAYLAEGKPISPTWKQYFNFGHPGFAWAARREAIDATGGLLDRAILGSADHHMSWALIGQAQKTIPPGVHPNYRAMVMRWQDRAKALHQDVGVVPGTMMHSWHGRKTDRAYVDRWGILIRNQYDPDNDVFPDHQGVLQLEPSLVQLRNDIRRYFRARREDANTVD